MASVSKPLSTVAQVTIVGVGLLGGSIGLALRAAGFAGRIVGVGRRSEVVARAKALRCIDDGAASVHEAIAQATKSAAACDAESTVPTGRCLPGDEGTTLSGWCSHLIILCTPLSTFAAIFAEIARHDRPNLIITDAGSTKAQVCADAARLLPDPSRFVGAHPMAGSELHGPEHAKADLFKGRLCILTPSATHSSERALATVRDLWQTLGMKLTEKAPDVHDRLAAAISHLPHASASLLVHLADKLKAISIAATGFRDTTRVASGDPRVWTDIFITNRQAMLDTIDHYAAELATFRALIESNDEAELLKLLEAAKNARDTWLKQTWGE